MRLEGHSYSDIQKSLNLPSKGTLSNWFKDLQLSPDAHRILRQRAITASKKNFRKFNAARSKMIKSENAKEFSNGLRRIGSLTARELMLIGAALYWGEGTKSDNNGKGPTLAFANSDPTMVKVYLQFVRKIFNVPNTKIRGGIHLYPATDVAKARKYWADTTKLPPDRFYVTTMVSRLSAGKRNPHLLPYGTVTLRVHNRKLFHHIKGMIRGLFEAKIISPDTLSRPYGSEQFATILTWQN